MFLNNLRYILNTIRTITSVIPTLDQRNLSKNRFLMVCGPRPSEGWGWGADTPYSTKVKNWLIPLLKIIFMSLHVCTNNQESNII